MTSFRAGRATPADYTGSDAAGTSGRATTRSRPTARSSTRSSTTASPRSRSSRRSASARRISAAPIWAVKVTKNADTEPDNTKPAVLYNAQQHAREWLAGETCRRTLDFFVDNYGETGTAVDHAGHAIPGLTAEEITELVDTRELWFVLHLQPGRLRVHVHARTTGCGARTWPTTTATASSASPRTASTRTATSPPTGATTTRAPRTTRPRRPTAAPGPASEPETKAMHASGTGSTSSSRRTTTRRPSCCSIRSATSSTRGRPTTAIFEALAGNDVDSGDRRQGVGTTEDEVVGVRRQPARRGRVASTASTRTSGPSSTSPTATRSRTRTTHGILGFTPEGSEPADRERLRLRVPGRRGRHRGRVPAPPAVLARPRPLGGRSGEPVLAPRQRRRGLLRRRLRRVLRRSAERRGERRSARSATSACATASTAAGSSRRRPRRRRAASGSTTRRASTTSACAAR